MKGYLPIAETFSERVNSYPVAISANFTRIRATCTFASSVLKLIVISCFFPGCKVPFK
jgi:hypothetical protein